MDLNKCKLVKSNQRQICRSGTLFVYFFKYMFYELIFFVILHAGFYIKNIL